MKGKKFLTRLKMLKLIDRLNKIGITLDLVANYPWIYIRKINGKVVTERYLANHGFTIAFTNGADAKLTDLKEIFKLLRKYK